MLTFNGCSTETKKKRTSGPGLGPLVRDLASGSDPALCVQTAAGTSQNIGRGDKYTLVAICGRTRVRAMACLPALGLCWACAAVLCHRGTVPSADRSSQARVCGSGSRLSSARRLARHDARLMPQISLGLLCSQFVVMRLRTPIEFKRYTYTYSTGWSFRNRLRGLGRSDF